MKLKKTVVSDIGVKLVPTIAKKVDLLLKNGAKYVRKSVISTPELDASKRSEVSIITTSGIDRDNEIVDPSGIDLSDYVLNPIVLFGHDQNKICGKNLWIKLKENHLLGKSYYPPRPKKYAGEWLPDFVFEMILADVLRGKSIGFLATEYRDPTTEERKLYGEIDRVIAKSLLLEYSCVSVPSNPQALLQSIEKGIAVDHWKIKKLGTAKKFVPKVISPQQQFINDVNNLKIDAKEIAELNIKSLLERWEV